MYKNIFYNTIESNFTLKYKSNITNWLNLIALNEKKKIETISYTFCKNTTIKKINNKYLTHNYPTDILTFDLRALHTQPISADIYIGIDIIRRNAVTYNTTFELELLRVLAHGLLHLIGYDDTTVAAQKQMREMEEYYLKLYMQK
ncbi:MAG: rRNA maturation RNase YbeY [Cytophagales bacterium]|nr:rRNA maturation RNase YbeY [Cytophagales bacterium]